MFSQKNNRGAAIGAALILFFFSRMNAFFKDIIAGSWQEFFYKQDYISFENAEWLVLHVFGYLEAVKVKLSGNVFGFLWNRVVFSYTVIILVIALLMAMLLAYMAINYHLKKNKKRSIPYGLLKTHFISREDSEKRSRNVVPFVASCAALTIILCFYAAYHGWLSESVLQAARYNDLVDILQHNVKPNALFLFFGLFFLTLTIPFIYGINRVNADLPKFKRILVLSQDYSCRSMMVEALIDHFGQGQFVATVGAFSPSDKLDPLTIKTLEASGIAFDSYKLSSYPLRSRRTVKRQAGQYFDLIISLDDETARQPLPHFIGPAKRIYWNIPKPAAEAGQAAYDEIYNLLGREVEKLLKDNPVI